MGKLLLLKTATPANRSALIDEAGDIKLKLAAFAATGVERRDKQLTEEFASWYPDKPEEEFIEKGQRYELRISARRNVTTIDIRAAYKKLGLRKFLSACSLTLKALAEFLTEPEVDCLTSTARTGSRAFVTTPLGVASPAVGEDRRDAA
jgi:hypothetical protein